MTAPQAQPTKAATQNLVREILALTAEITGAPVEDTTAAIDPAAFQPRDEVETMLAGLAVAHVRLIHKSMNEILAAPPGLDQSRGKAQLVALDRVLFGYLRELRTARKRPADSFAAPIPQSVPVPGKDKKRPSPEPSPARSIPGLNAAAFGLPPKPAGKSALLSGTASNLAAPRTAPLMPHFA